jgi:hypothetical protein
VPFEERARVDEVLEGEHERKLSVISSQFSVPRVELTTVN